MMPNTAEPSALADQWAGTVCARCLQQRCNCSAAVGCFGAGVDVDCAMCGETLPVAFAKPAMVMGKSRAVCKKCHAFGSSSVYTSNQQTKTDRSGDPRFYRLIDEISALHARKSQDYAPGADPLANFKASTGVGVRPYSGILTRLLDKWGRIATAAKGGALVNESLRDSHIDSAVYHLLAVLLLEDETKG